MRPQVISPRKPLDGGCGIPETNNLVANIITEACMVWLKTVIFTILVPGGVTVWVPMLLLWITPSADKIGPFQLLGLIPIVIGAATYFLCAWDFASMGGGTPAPFSPTQNMVARGLYRFSRNPMYVGVTMVVLGEAWLFKSWALFIWAAMDFTFDYIFVKYYEEPGLIKQYGKPYLDYINRTPRWIPIPRLRNTASD